MMDTTIEAPGADLFALTLATASGQATRIELRGYGQNGSSPGTSA